MFGMLDGARRPANDASARRNVVARGAKVPTRGNVEGQFFVDTTCINCDTCRWMSKNFEQVGSQSAVTSQPETREERIAAIQATLSCPTFSINMRYKDAAELREAQAGMPIPVAECPGVYHCGFHSEASYGATSYIVVRPEGNIMMDCPRFNPLLARNIEALGGVSFIVLSHIDDIADHDKWAQYFGAPRIMHEAEIRPSISDIEVQLMGHGPWDLTGEVVEPQHLDGGVQIVHTPGHTAGSISMWHAPSRAMFTGDHLGYSHRVGRTSIFPRYNRAGLKEQVKSVQKLLEYDFLHILPGHGRRVHLEDEQAREELVTNVTDAELAAA